MSDYMILHQEDRARYWELTKHLYAELHAAQAKRTTCSFIVPSMTDHIPPYEKWMRLEREYLDTVEQIHLRGKAIQASFVPVHPLVSLVTPEPSPDPADPHS